MADHEADNHLERARRFVSDLLDDFSLGLAGPDSELVAQIATACALVAIAERLDAIIEQGAKEALLK